MYKGTQDQSDYLKRVASHATKPSRRGIIKDIPAWAREPEEYYNSLLEQFDALTNRLHDARQRVIWIKQQLRNTLPFETYTKLKNELEVAGPSLVEIEQQCGALRLATRAAANNAWGAVFYYIASHRLDVKIFREIDIATQELLQRQHQEMSPPGSERSPEYKKTKRRNEVLKDKRRKVREALASGTYGSFVPKSGKWHAR